MTGIWMLLSGVNNIPDQVVKGDLDLIMTKPGSLQFLQTFGKYNFALAFPNVVMGTVLMIGGWNLCKIPVTLSSVGIFVFYLITGIDTDHLGNCDTGIGFLAGEAYVESGNQAVYKCEWLKKGVTALMKGKSSAQRLLYLSSKLNSLFTKDKVSISF